MKAPRGHPTQWTSMYTSDGELSIGVVINGEYGEIHFPDSALLDLKKHVDTAIAQRALRPALRAR